MDPVGVNSIETAALGRPFQLGMLYDCRRDALVPGIKLWTNVQLQQNKSTKPQINTIFTVTASDSIEEKSKLLNIDGHLKLSLLGGLINVSGAATFLKDTKTSFSQQRLTLHYHSTTKFEELTINHFTSGEMAHYDDGVATHVVTAVLYGADACFVFDREVSADEDKRVISGEVKVAFQYLKGISAGANISRNDNQKTVPYKFRCTFYGDFQLPSNPTTFEDAVKVFQDLPNLLGENKELAVLLRVWLYPIDKLFSRPVKFQHEISTGLISEIESVIESLSTTEMKCNDLLTDAPASTFTAFQDKINSMRTNCYQCRLSLMSKLGSLLPKIRGKFIEDTALIDLLQEHEKSPFERNTLERWMKEKEEESDIIKSLLTQLNESGVTVETNLNKNLMNLKVKHLVIYTFTSLNWPDVLLSDQKTFLSPSSEQKPSESEHKTWLMPDIQNIMRKNLKVFKNLVDLNDIQSVKFIVSSKDHEKHPGSCILLYENESNEAVCFTPPSKPDSPVIKDIRNSRVVLTVSPACPATEELKILYKTKEDTDWTSQSVSEKQDSVTLTDLRSDTEYQIKYTAVGKLNYTVDSNVTRLKVIKQNLIKAKESVIEDLSWAENKCSSLLDNSRGTAFSALYKKIQDMQKNCQTYRQEFSAGVKPVIQSVKACEKESRALEDLLQAHDESPFNGKSLKEWITVREAELNTVNELHQQLVDLGAETNRSLDSYLSDIQVENVFSYTFTSLGLPDELLNEQNHHMKVQMMRNPLKKPDVASQTWLTGEVREKMRENLKLFKELMMLHSSPSTKFIISRKDHEKHSGSCILLYENGCNEGVCYKTPSKPDCPVIKDVRYRQVTLKVSPMCPVTEELKLLYKMKNEKDWTSQTVSEKQDSVTLTDLRSDTEYLIKCTAVGKLNYTTESDVTTVITKNNTELIKKSIIEEDRNPARCKLKTTTVNRNESYRKITFGERNKSKPHKTILLAGETGTGKTTLINVMVNHMLGVQREDKVWFEITDDQSDQSSAHSQTSSITVYGVYLEESPMDLTIIDTPGYGDTRGVQKDKEIAMHLLGLSKSEKGINELDAVCLVMKATQSRLDDRQMYIFDAVQSLFGRDIAENIVLLLTHSRGAIPRNYLTAVKEDQIKCAVDEQNQPVFFMFDNCQSDTHDEEYSENVDAQHKMLEQSWEISFTGIKRFYSFLENIKPKSLMMTRDVLEQRIQLEKNISSIQSQDQMMVEKQSELKQTLEALEKEQEYFKNDQNFEREVKVEFREMVEITDPALAKGVMCCIDCKENCPIEESWSISSPFSKSTKCHSTWCTNQCKHIKGAKYETNTRTEKRINDDLQNFEREVEEEYSEIEINDSASASTVMCCTDCKEYCPYEDLWAFSSLFSKSIKCHSTQCTKQCNHIKGAKYETKTRIVKRINEDLKKQCEEKLANCSSLAKNQEKDLRDLETRKIKLIFKAFHCVDTLEKIALNTDSLFILQHVDFLIEKLKEIDEPEKAKTLEDIKRRAGERGKRT